VTRDEFNDFMEYTPIGKRADLLYSLVEAAETHECPRDENTGHVYCSDGRKDHQCSLTLALAALRPKVEAD